LLAISFPNFSVAGLAWVAPALMLLAAMGRPLKQAFRIGYVAGLTHYLISLYWLLHMPVAWLPILGWAALAAYLALFPATWVWFCWRTFPIRLGDDQGSPDFAGLIERFHSVPWPSRLRWSITGAAAWVAWEMIVSRLWSGFPWNLLGSSQYQMVPLIQVASWTGIYGVSFLAVWSALSLLNAGVGIARKPAMRSVWVGEILPPMTVVAALYFYGYHQLLRRERVRPELRVLMVQPSIPQTMIWDPESDASRFQDLLRLSENGLTNQVDLLIWPESAIPKMVRYNDDIFQPISRMAREHQIWMIIGSDDREPNPHSVRPEDDNDFNSSFLVSPRGQLVERYSKRHLVIFGEYIPLVRWLPFLKYLTPIDSGFAAGNHAVPFRMADLDVNTAVLICFEDMFPQLVREYVRPDTDFLVNITNDGWFGESAAQWQQAASAVFRAVENGAPLLRCSNNGLTCWADSRGRIRELFTAPTQGVYGPGFMVARVPLLRPGEKRSPTFYNRHGDWFGWACVALALLACCPRPASLLKEPR
jgi:apolipoprotein N-acyltransferase